MDERCPICDSELLGNEYCTNCKRRIIDEKLQIQVEILNLAITGWKNVHKELAYNVRKLLLCFDDEGEERIIPDYIIQELKELTKESDQ